MNTNKDFEKLETIRGEVLVQAHLLKADLKDKFKELEQEWSKLSSQLKRVRVAADQESVNVNAATTLLVETLRAGYQNIKNTLRAA